MTIKCFLLIRMANLQLYYIVLHLQTIKLKNRECGRLKAAWQKWWTVVILVAATCCTQWKNATIYSICFIFHVHIKMKDWVQNLAGVFFKWQNIVVKPVLKKELYASRIRGISQSSYITIRIEQLADDLHNVFFSIQARRRLVCHSTKASHQGTNNFGDFCTMCVSSYNLGIFSFWLMLLGHIQNFVTQK